MPSRSDGLELFPPVKYVSITVRDHVVLSQRVQVANNLVSRLIGLLGRKSLASGEGLWILPCNSIHMWGMKFAIDALFVSKDLVVVKCCQNLQPGEVVWPVRGAYSVFELPAGWIAETRLKVGDQLKVLQAGTP